MATIRKIIDLSQNLTEEQHKEIEQASRMSINYDDDSPETTEELYALYEPIAASQRAQRINSSTTIVSA